MSLVAYGASDDSGESDEDAPPITTQLHSSSSAVAVNGLSNSNNNNTDVKIESQGPSASKLVGDSISDEDEPSHLMKGLPAPKQLVNGRLDIVDDDVLEEMVKAKPSQLPQITVPAKKQGKERQSVKITVPALTTDSDEEEPQRKKIKKSAKGSGLFSLLPAPRNVSLKETNRILLPHTLKTENVKNIQKVGAGMTGSSPAVKSPNVPAVKFNERVPARPLVDVETGSDTDEEDISFFSLPEAKPPCSLTPFYKPSSSVAALTTLPSPSVTASHSSENKLIRDFNMQKDSREEIGSYDGSESSSSSSQDMPLSFKSDSFPERQSASLLSHSQASYPSYSGQSQYHHGYPTTEEYFAEQQTEDRSEVNQVLQDEEFLKLQGKAGRGREQVKFIDVDTNQFTGTQDLMKTLTVEKEHTAHRKKDNQPSGRQRSKHQITYLAFQAKERELTLKNQWSQNRQSKRQTQSKYGF